MAAHVDSRLRGNDSSNGYLGKIFIFIKATHERNETNFGTDG